ncbi:MAG TPA: hypothetical protein VD710_06425 [Nitrososphaeraceae archaeon]|nr:hypothetical protein [Nitrososphaeraceae archaeon]
MTKSFYQGKNFKSMAITASILVAIVAASSYLLTMNLGQAQGQEASAGSVLKLARASIPIDIPLAKGYENGNDIYFIATDASDEELAQQATKLLGFKVNFAPLLSQTPESALSQAYAFTNGVPGKGPFGFQVPVLSTKPGDANYSALFHVNTVTWKDISTVKELKSVQEIMTAEKNGSLTVNKTGIVVNHPAIKWQGGEMKVRENKNINDDSTYGPAQVLNIDTEKMIVTMVAHRGWGPDGKSIYYIVTDATPEMPANMMGVSSVPLNEKLASSPVAVDLFQFMNGINGSGPMGFQAGIGAANPTDKNYSPMWKISFNEWKDPSQARVLETLNDVVAMQKAGMITITPALEGKHVVNCPFFDQSTIAEHISNMTGT